MKKNSVCLYNIILPIWMMAMVPPLVFVSLGLSYAIDTLVLRICGNRLTGDGKALWKSSILRVWLLGFAADFVGSVWMFLPALTDWSSDFINAVMLNPFSHPLGLVWTIVGLLISGVLIYIFNLKLGLKKAELTDEQRKKAALRLAVFTAPYLFLIPMVW